MGNKNSQFAPNADGLGWCPNRKNSSDGHIGINNADLGNNANRFQSRADEKADINIPRKAEYCDFTAADVHAVNQGLTLLNDHFKSEGFIVAAMGDHETIIGDVENSDLSAEKKAQFELEHPKSTRLDTDASLADHPSLKSIVEDINTVISRTCSWINRPDNGRNNASLGLHELVRMTPEKANILHEAGYGVRYSGMDLMFYARNNCDGSGLFDEIWCDAKKANDW